MNLGFPLGFPLGFSLGGLDNQVLLPETQAILNRWISLGTPASTQRANGLDKLLVRPLVNSGNWSKLDALYTPQHSSDASRVNLKNPSADLLTLVNTPTIVADRYFQGDGVSSYFDTGINPATAGGNFALNDACLFVWSVTDSASAEVDAGSGNGTRVRSTTTSLSSRANLTSDIVDTVADSLGLYGWTRSDGTNAANFKGASAFAPQAATATGIASAAMRICSAGTSFSPRRLAVMGWGGGLTVQNIFDLHAISAAWLTYLGAI